MIRTRFAPSPTGYMHIGNLRTALYEYLIAKHDNGKFILRIEDTDQGRLVEGSVDVIYNTLKIAGLEHDEGPDIGGEYGPYTQSERKNNYLKFAKKLIETGNAYYCFCTKERLEEIDSNAPYDRHCKSLTKEEINEKLEANTPYVIRQFIPEGKTSFDDLVYGKIEVDNKELEDQILIKSDGLPTYNFANVVDDHLMNITHVVRGSEYLSSTPKYNLLYDAFGFEKPIYVHLPLILNESGEKLSKRKGDASFEDLITQGFLPEAIINYIALLGWAPRDNQEFFTLDELVKSFDIKGLSKSPSSFDTNKLKWMNAEYFKKMSDSEFYNISKDILKSSIIKDVDLSYISTLVKSRITFLNDIPQLVDFIDNFDKYDTELFVHKKMKTTTELSKDSLSALLPLLEDIIENDWTLDYLHDKIMEKISQLEIKNGQMLWPLRTALSGKPTSPCGGIDILVILGKEESIKRIEFSIDLLNK
ncbi:MAG: glutamate--tRNA ligase [Lachnospirales bacterium]